MNIQTAFETILLMAAGAMIGVIAMALLRALTKDGNKKPASDG